MDFKNLNHSPPQRLSHSTGESRVVARSHCEQRASAEESEFKRCLEAEKILHDLYRTDF